MDTQNQIDYKSDENAEMIVKFVFYGFIQAQHRGKVEKDKARVKMFTQTLNPENEEAAKIWWEDENNVPGNMASIDQCKNFVQKFWKDEILKKIYDMTF